jgi:TldD protein
MGGVLFHEAVGHPLEADIVDKEASVYRGRIGEHLASEILNGVDDATVPSAWGSFSFGGQTNPATGDFVFGCAEAYLIEDGATTAPVRGANLIGRAIEVMSHVDGLAQDFDIWPGVCGKEGQSVPVGSGSPTLRISKITVGGTGA